MRVRTRVDYVLKDEIMIKLAQEGMFDTDSLDALHSIYYKIKKKRGVRQPYADDYKLDAKYANTKDMWEDVKEQVEIMASLGLGKRLKESRDAYDKMVRGE